MAHNHYALIFAEKISNIIIVDDNEIASFVSTLENVDSYVCLDDEHFSARNIPQPGYHWNGTDFYPPSWVQNSDKSFSAPIPMPTDGNKYEWDESRQEWIQLTPYPSWTYDPQTRFAYAPVLMPEDGNEYIWDESIKNWVKITPRPMDGKDYWWNPNTEEWELVAE